MDTPGLLTSILPPELLQLIADSSNLLQQALIAPFSEEEIAHLLMTNQYVMSMSIGVNCNLFPWTPKRCHRQTMYLVLSPNGPVMCTETDTIIETGEQCQNSSVKEINVLVKEMTTTQAMLLDAASLFRLFKRRCETLDLPESLHLTTEAVRRMIKHLDLSPEIRAKYFETSVMILNAVRSHNLPHRHLSHHRSRGLTRDIASGSKQW